MRKASQQSSRCPEWRAEVDGSKGLRARAKRPLKSLENACRRRNKVLAVREPGGTPVGDAIRAILSTERELTNATKHCSHGFPSGATARRFVLSESGTWCCSPVFSTPTVQVSGRGFLRKGARGQQLAIKHWYQTYALSESPANEGLARANRE